MISVKVTGLNAMVAKLAGMEKQVRFATAKALTQTAHAGRDAVKVELKAGIQGDATPYTLCAFNVEAATKAKLESRVYLRQDGPGGGTEYSKALSHLFTGGGRRWKRLEGWMRGKGIIPNGYMIAPGPKAPLDARGNFRQAQLKEMLGILSSGLRNIQVYRKSGAGKGQKAIGFFVAMPGDKSGLPPGIWRRINTGQSSAVEPWIMFIRPVAYQQKFDLQKIVRATVDREFTARFDRALADALRTAK